MAQLSTKFILLATLCLGINLSYAQKNSPNDVFIGKWVTVDKQAGYEISEQAISKIYKEEDNTTWKITPWESEKLDFVDSVFNSSDKVYESWVRAESTLVAYPTSGGVEYTTTITYSVYKIQLLDRNTIKLSISVPYKFVKEMGIPVITQDDMIKIRKDYLENKKIQSTLTLIRLR